jgi:hypothetical protein
LVLADEASEAVNGGLGHGFVYLDGFLDFEEVLTVLEAHAYFL